ncbi:MAG TPA: VWA domain-containing protein [Acetobacteraceae bacterium]|nr:VWA domain-containing protein [Acetobacteraceae bacterium]
MTSRAFGSLVLLAAMIPAGATAPSRPPERGQETTPIFSARSELVVLYATVTDRDRAYVSGLTQDAFTVFEDGRPQQVQQFSVVDTPVTVGLVIDDSASMYGTRTLVAAAAGAFAATSNSDDEIFALTFNYAVRPVLPADRPFTNSAEVLRNALSMALLTQGKTAFNDAVIAGLAYVARGVHPRKVLVVVSDGADNASTIPFERVVRETEVSNTMIYTLAIADRADSDSRRDRLKALAVSTGGQTFHPHTAGEVAHVLRRVARDIRNTYTLGYIPSDTAAEGAFRHVRVAARGPNGEGLTVRTRDGYVAEGRAR